MNSGITLRRTWFSLTEGIAIAFDAIRANRARAALTILGVAVGVFVVVIISAAVHGINMGVAKDFEAAGPTSFVITRFPSVLITACDESGDTCKWRNNPPITSEELAAVSQLPAVFAAAGAIDAQASVSYRNHTLPGPQIQGWTPNWMVVDGGDIVPGRSFTTAENTNAEPVIIVNDKMANELFGEMNPLDKIILVRGESFRIIGVYHAAGSFLSGGDRARAIVPYETARRRLNSDAGGTSIRVKPWPSVSRDDALDQVTAMLRGRRGLKPSAGNNFDLVTQDYLFDTYNKIFGMFFLVMVVLSGIGLVVGGVGVVAIMTISVTERTREIGVRKALGATRRTILWQFLVEAVTLTSIGALAGLAAGWLVAVVISRITPVPASVPAGAIVAALMASAVTGVLFGIYPAARAAGLNPVDALRYE